MGEVWQPTETELIAAIKAHPGRMLEVKCILFFRLGELFWLAGDTYKMSASQLMGRFYMNLPGFLTHFQFTKSADEIFPRPRPESLSEPDTDDIRVDAWGGGIMIGCDAESMYLDSKQEGQLLAILLQRKAEREGKQATT